ncbi:MAG: hypothetical protein EOQ98_34220 [Mesorhizobium sp.]|nr:MAG: hypothetical protein EOQ98_34220 [Mesorhizobium sp.]TIM51753.1 MAG: hypothetical protein E5Y69_04160 [Mesorhizobium sp.]
MKCFALAIGLLLGVSDAFAWDGTDTTGESVEIGKGNLVRTGRDIEIFDGGSGEYRDVTVESIRRYGSTVEVEVYDTESGEYRTLEMEDD